MADDSNGAKVVPLQDDRRTLAPAGQRLVQPPPLNRRIRDDFVGIRPERLRGVINDARKGDFEHWADLASFMLRQDAHVRSVYTTLLVSIAGAEWEVHPGLVESDSEKGLAEDAAAHIQVSLERVRGLRGLWEDLLHAEGIGIAAAEHRWERIKGTWRSTPRPILPRDVGFTNDWHVKVRTYAEGRERWLRVDEQHPFAFMAHVPGGVGETPNLSGILMPVAWPWLFKRWSIVAQNRGLEWHGTPKILGKLGENASSEAAKTLFDALKNWTFDSVGVTRGDTEITTVEASNSTGQGWREAIDQSNAEITKAILGSTLNVEIDHAGGNRAAAESQGNITILPRLQAIAGRLEDTHAGQWFEYDLQLNKHLFNGQMPPVPQLTIKLEQEEPPTFTDVDIAAGLRVKQDEYRQAKGLPPLGPEQGGEIFVKPTAKTQPEPSLPFARETDAQDEEPGQVPFGVTQRTRLPLTTTRRKTSGTSGHSQTRTARVPFEK